VAIAFSVDVIQDSVRSLILLSGCYTSRLVLDFLPGASLFSVHSFQHSFHEQILMASTATATASVASVDESRPQAGPIPSKRGEIGYREDLHEQESQRDCDREDSRSVMAPLPERHPADRDVQAASDVTTTPAVAAASATHSNGKKRIIEFLAATQQKIPKYGGISLTTLVLFIVQSIFLCATIATWVIAIRRLNRPSNDSNDPNSQSSGTDIGSSAIFFHVLFLMLVIGQFVFVERRLFRLRAERYAYLHSGEMLPTARRPPNTSMGIAPWHRPSLPTYAASLAQSGHGTGDVEDNIIAVAPPPAYGQTRNSRLLLTGFLRNSLRAQRPISVHSQMSQQDDRPISYVSHDEQWQEIQDAERAIKLEETLSTLEVGDAVPTGSTSAARI